MDLNCYLIEPAENFIALLCTPISLYFNNNNEKSSLYMKWKFNFIELDKIAVKGKKEGVRIYSILSTDISSDFHNDFLKLYRSRKWTAALKIAEIKL